MDLKEAEIFNSKTSPRHPWEVARIEVVFKLLQTYLPCALYKGAALLDLGCGDTFLTEQLSTKLPDSSFIAIDIAFTDEMVIYYNKKFTEENVNLKVFRRLEDIDSIRINVVLLLDVLEHIADDVAFLKSIIKNTYITADTYFLITVPSYQALFSSHDIFLGHYRRYNSLSLEKTINKAGLHTEKIGCFFTTLLIIRIIQISFEKIIKASSSKGVASWKGGKILSTIIKSILILDFKLAYILGKKGILIHGLSNYIICKKFV